MNGISHKQAVQWIHRRLDGLLDESQLLMLDEHLNSCEFCRTYAAQLDSLPAELQSKFHARWDEESGPSRKVLQYVTMKARRIPISNRISSGVMLLAGTVTLILLGIALNFVVSRLQSISHPANATETIDSPLPQERLLTFASDQNGNFDVYTTRADGSGSKNLTNDPAMDTTPYWSPDGKQIAFQSDRDGFRQIYLMNADGSNVVQLTREEAHHGFMNYMYEFSPWSPDGSRLLIGETLPGEDTWKLHVLDINEGRKTLLVDESNVFSAISWSPDGQHIALHTNDSQRGDRSRIFIINADGSNLREITKSFTPDEPVYTFDYHWSLDGRSFFFIALFLKNNSWTAYEANLVDNSLIEHVTTNDLLYGWWNDIYLVNNSSASAPFEWIRPDGASSRFNPTEKCEHIDLYQSDSTVKRSPNGNWVVTGQCANGDTWLYWANSEGTQIKRLLDSPISITDTFLSPVSWSEDDRFVVFTTNSLSDSGDLYILDVSQALKDHSIQPVRLPDRSLPAWQPIP